ncbi:hypothetical protein ACFVFS_32560 [Kitasatospora sp. NPDC057692]|uniref:hypothetical protein n=1 Tax=Kitasatospora sp. NPDC057692 TaxID=3346215 RepID=UPI00368A522F
MITVERYGAFSVNCVGLARLPFPLSFSVREAEGSWMISAAAARAAELIDVLTRTADDTVVVVNLATDSSPDEADRPFDGGSGQGEGLFGPAPQNRASRPAERRLRLTRQ